MIKKLLVLLFVIKPFAILCQEDFVDNKYREDQIYINLNYNSLKSTPENFSQNKFSSSLSLGFIRDIPINKNRNFGLGLGLGFSSGSYNNNYKFTNSSGSFIVESISDLNTFQKNKWTLNQLEFPFELRWRTSTPTNYKFWRIYTGIKTSYLISSKSKFSSSTGSQTLSGLPFNKIQYGLTVNLGNNTWNIGLFFGLNPIFEDEFVEKNQNIKNIKPFKVGLVFYIL